jgi:hypothetical protein
MIQERCKGLADNCAPLRKGGRGLFDVLPKHIKRSAGADEGRQQPREHGVVHKELAQVRVMQIAGDPIGRVRDQ